MNKSEQIKKMSNFQKYEYFFRNLKFQILIKINFIKLYIALYTRNLSPANDHQT